MRPTSDPDVQAFAFLRRSLARRRFSQLELRLRLELGLLAGLLTAFVFWQVRTPLAALHAQGGPRAVAGVLGLAFLLLGLLTLGVVAFRHARRLLAGPPGPPWLAMPASHRALEAHLAWDSRLVAIWIVVPALGAWAAGFGLVPELWLAAAAPLLAWLLAVASRGGAALGLRAAAWASRSGGGPAIFRVLAASPRRTGVRRLRPAGWRRAPVWLALCEKDLRVTRRVGTVARQLGVALALWGLSLAAWRLPEPGALGGLDYLAAFVLALLGSAALGEWLVALSGSDPFATVRSLPVGPAAFWGARFAWAALGAIVLLALHAVAAEGLAPQALRLFLGWVGAATLAIAALAVNYGVTLFPRADLAQRLLGLSLGLAVAASLMIPLLGWIVLLAAVIHSARRLPRWHRLEEA
jgi:hypothetical protein